VTRHRKRIRFGGRYWLTRTLMTAVLVLLAGRALQLQVLDSDYLQQQGNSRYLRVVNEVPTRGMIVDRNNQPLAISTPVDSLWANPEVLSKHRTSVVQLARLLDTNVGELRNELQSNRNKEFMYLKRQVSPRYAESILQHDIPGVSVQREYRRYYPVGEAAGHVIGFSNIDDKGQEGAELLYNSVLTGHAGKSRVLKDRLGHTVEMVESLGLSEAGRNVQLSIDRRLQYLAYRELKRAVIQHRARAGTAVIVDIKTGEILAMVSQPSFNPNNRSDLSSDLVRNRAATDLYEPGSTLKPFTIAAALEEHLVKPSSTFDTSPGYITIDSRTIRDARDHGRLTVSGIIKKSSNVGAARIALKIPANKMHANLLRFGFTQDSGADLPGEADGQLLDAARWTRVDQASLAFGYGISITSLQLARAYAALANDGVLVPLSLRKLDAAPTGARVVSRKTARLVRSMLEGVVAPGGTGTAARVPFYRVAGKTGTVHKFINGTYSEDHYLALFAGYAPASHPRLAMVVTVDDPTSQGYYGGQVAAPVFSRVMGGALRLLNVMPDETTQDTQHLVKSHMQEAG